MKAPSARQKPKLLPSGLAASVVVFAALCFIFFPQTTDDAFISARYAERLITTHTLTFNDFERVEGFSNPLWVFLLALLGLTGMSVTYLMKILSFCAGLMAIVTLSRVSRVVFTEDSDRRLLPLLLATSSFFALWAVDGLETVFYSCLITLLYYNCIAPADLGKRGIGLGLLAAAIALTRPEGILYAGVCVVFLTWRRAYLAALKVLAAIVVFPGAYLIFRKLYFGLWVPNTALSKMLFYWDPNPTSMIVRGLTYLHEFNVAGGMVLFPLVLWGLWRFRKRPDVFFATAGFIAAAIFFVLVSNGDTMFGYRFVAPILPVLFVALLNARPRIPSWGRACSIVTWAIVLWVGTAQFLALPSKSVGWGNLTDLRYSPHTDIGEFLSGESATRNDVVLLSEAGVIPFVTKGPVVDYLGVVTRADRVLSAEDGRFTLNGPYLFSRKPRYVVLSLVAVEDGRRVGRMPQDRVIQESGVLDRFYRLVRRFPVRRDGKYNEQIYYRDDPTGRAKISFEIYERLGPVRDR